MAATNAESVAKLSKSRVAHRQLVAYGTKVLAGSKNQAEEGWNAREVLIRAYLDEGEVEKADALVLQLRAKFGEKSQRVGLLEGMVLEAKGEWNLAQLLYESIIKTNWTNMAAAKRLYVLKRAQGQLAEAAKLLNSLLNENQADLELWMEMCDLQMTVGAFEQALFCAEEILLGHPHSYLSNCLYAELLLASTQGTQESIRAKWLKESRSYYSQSLVLKGEQGYARAAWGLLLVTKAQKDKSDDTDAKLKQKAIQLLTKAYEKSPVRDLVEPVLKRLGN